ncbi:hypothetical protein GGR92_002228 [Spirosoma lacussanchae]
MAPAEEIVMNIRASNSFMAFSTSHLLDWLPKLWYFVQNA